MSKLSLLESRKFRRLQQRLGDIQRPHLRGHLDCLWDSADRDRTPIFRDKDDVECGAEWTGERGVFADALVELGWLDTLDDGRLYVHDYFEHRPDWVLKAYGRRYSINRSEVARLNINSYLKLEASVREVQVPEGGRRTADNGRPRVETGRQNSGKGSQSKTGLGNSSEETANLGTPGASRPIDAGCAQQVGSHCEELAAIRGGRFPKQVGSDPARSGGTHAATTSCSSGAVPIGELLGDATSFAARIVEQRRAEMLGSILMHFSENWRSWWDSVIDHLYGDIIFLDALKHVQDCTNPILRETKGLGELKNPAGFLIKKATVALRQKSLGWPSFPERVDKKAAGTAE